MLQKNIQCGNYSCYRISSTEIRIGCFFSKFSDAEANLTMSYIDILTPIQYFSEKFKFEGLYFVFALMQILFVA